jgi:hypothetical protein
MRRSRVWYVVRNDDRWPIMGFRQLAGEPGARQAMLMKRIGGKKRARAGGTTYQRVVENISFGNRHRGTRLAGNGIVRPKRGAENAHPA